MCEINKCAMSVWNKLPALETKEQTDNHLFSTTRKVLSCVPYLGFFMGIYNHENVYQRYWDHENDKLMNEDAAIKKMFTFIRCYTVSAALTAICSLALKIFTAGYFTWFYLGSATIVLCKSIYDMGLKTVIVHAGA